ncbi:uncharacterized protein EI90DRAFT_3042061 [Cantharellus anzutake]|uniref:uncharacterized protein n=1 Tax=Cantharellus anzutake TaxID=1750568 RepID=UPI0019033D0D|nr:uncharacterized protein EI90DRAFT_3042061 [Cantharellus anzutake]KAF8338196.1 hypothetical protein EI90DRAFT_3042061 [Cantharellus anzutake]
MKISTSNIVQQKDASLELRTSRKSRFQPRILPIHVVRFPAYLDHLSTPHWLQRGLEYYLIRIVSVEDSICKYGRLCLFRVSVQIRDFVCLYASSSAMVHIIKGPWKNFFSGTFVGNAMYERYSNHLDAHKSFWDTHNARRPLLQAFPSG